MKQAAMLVLGASLATSLAASGCGGGDDAKADGGKSPSAKAPAPKTPSAAPKPASVPRKFRQIGGPPQGVRLGVPKAWQDFDLSTVNTDSAIRQMGLSKVQARVIRQAFTQLKTFNAVYAADTKHLSPKVPTNVNAFCAPVQGVSSVDDLVRQAPEQLKVINATQIAPAKTHVGGTEGVRTTYSIANGTAAISGTQYRFLKGDRVCTVTFSTDRPDKYQKKFDKMAKTIAPA